MIDRDVAIATIEKALVLGDDRPIRMILADVPEQDPASTSVWIRLPFSWRCEKCGADKLQKTSFCPECGAKMTGTNECLICSKN